MFKRSEKKIKAVFKMQFQATQVPQLKAKGLMISLVPVDVGKPTVRLAKAPILEGTCTWDNPVYETVKLVKETKTGRIREKFYYVIVSTGSSKSGFLGEVSIDFADLAEASNPVNLTLPLQTSKSGAVLHVTVQNMQGGADSRNGEDSESPVAESYDPNLDKEARFLHLLEKETAKSPESDESTEVTSPHNVYNGSIEDTESENHDSERKDKYGRLTNEMKLLERRTERSELEVQSLRKQIIKETKRGQQLSEQIVSLKEERDALKAESEQLKSSLTSKNEDRVLSHTTKETENLGVSLEKIKQELQREKQLNKKLKLQVQMTEDSNSEYVLAMRDLNKKLELKNAEISRLFSKIKAFQSGSEGLGASPRTKIDDDAEMMKQKTESLYSEIEAYKKEKAEMQMQVDRLTLDYDSVKEENKDICAKLEHIETEEMELQHSYTEAMAREKKLKLQIASLEAENKQQSRQYSKYLNMIDELEFHVESLQKELESQAQVFEEDLERVTTLKIEQEQRASQAEEALRKARQSNVDAAEEFKQISAEMSLKIDENEKIARTAVTEVDDLYQQNQVLEGLLQKAEEEVRIIREKYERILREHSEQKKIPRDESEHITITKEMETLQRWKSDKEDLKRELDSVRKETEKLVLENVSMKSQIDQKKTKEDNLHLQVKKLRLKNNEVKNHLVESELEKEDLKKEMAKLQDMLRMKEQELEKAAAQNSLTFSVNDNPKNNNKEVGSNLEKKQTVLVEQLEEEAEAAEEINAMAFEGRANKGKNVNDVEVRVIEDLPVQKSGQSGDGCYISSLLSEVASLKEINKGMEEELKEMHDRYSEISLRFAEVEGERQQLVMALRNMKSGKKN